MHHSVLRTLAVAKSSVMQGGVFSKYGVRPSRPQQLRGHQQAGNLRDCVNACTLLRPKTDALRNRMRPRAAEMSFSNFEGTP